MWHEAPGGGGVVVAMRSKHVGADFEGPRPDCRPQPGEYIRGRRAHGGERRLEHPRGESAPPGVRGGDDASLGVGEKHR